MDELILNRKRTTKKRISFGVNKVIVSGVVFNKRVANSFVDEAESKIISTCKHNSIEYINNGNISNIHLFDDGLHLLELGMCILANNFICNLNCFFTNSFTPSERTFLTNGIVTHENSVSHQHFIKSVRIRSYSGMHFSAFGLNNSKYGHFLRTAKLRSANLGQK